MYLWYEQWSKAGASPNFRVDNPELYVSGFNWVKNWIDIYFFNKVSDNILVIITISLVVFFFLFIKQKNKALMFININSFIF